MDCIKSKQLDLTLLGQPVLKATSTKDSVERWVRLSGDCLQLVEGSLLEHGPECLCKGPANSTHAWFEN